MTLLPDEFEDKFTFTFLNIKKKFRKVVGIKKNNRLLGNKAYGKFLSSIW